jgi:hypothetical protein
MEFLMWIETIFATIVQMFSTLFPPQQCVNDFASGYPLSAEPIYKPMPLRSESL